jgi:cytochrome c553
MDSRRFTRFTAGLAACGALLFAGVAIASDGLSAASAPPSVPAWLFPLNPPSGKRAADTQARLRLPGSDAAFSAAQLKNMFDAVDWFPQAHAAMPPIVATGRAPEVYACGYCHTPSGQGRPENAALAGLPAAYIVQQVADFKSGARRNAPHTDAYRPNGLMITVAERVSDVDLAAAAAYFAAQQLRRRVVVLERTRIPHLTVVGWVYARAPEAGDEPLGERLIEMMPDAKRHEMRDDSLVYRAYVPPGSIGRGRRLATGDSATACTSCHGPALQGEALAPPLAGRSPSYVMRQLLAFQSGARSAPAGKPMQAVAAPLRIADMIDLAAYTASVPLRAPPHAGVRVERAGRAPQLALSAE